MLQIQFGFSSTSQKCYQAMRHHKAEQGSPFLNALQQLAEFLQPLPQHLGPGPSLPHFSASKRHFFLLWTQHKGHVVLERPRRNKGVVAEHLCSRFGGFVQPVLLSCTAEGWQEARGGKASHHHSPVLPILGCTSQNGGGPLFYRAEGALCVHQDGAGQRDVRDGVRKGMHEGERSVRWV